MTHRSPTAPERLLAAARTEFAGHGLAGARTDRIASRARVNKQLIHYYFGTKEGLYGAALERASQEVGESLARLPLAGLTAVERLRRLVSGQFDYLAEHPELTRFLIRAEGAGDWYDRAVEPLAHLLVDGQATGFFRDDVEPLEHARLSLLLNLGYFALRPLTSRWGEAGVWRDRTADLLVKGCTW